MRFVSSPKSFSPRKACVSTSSRGHRYSRLIKICYDMHLSPSFRGVVLSLIFAGANALSFNAQSQYAAAGGQAPLPGTLPGSQAHPYASLSGSGGFLVWDDNTADKDGLGIRASA